MPKEPIAAIKKTANNTSTPTENSILILTANLVHKIKSDMEASVSTSIAGIQTDPSLKDMSMLGIITTQLTGSVKAIVFTKSSFCQ